MEGNQMKMREVIKALLDVLYDMGIDEETVAISAKLTNCHMNSSKILETIRNAKAALAEPPRNCDRFCGDPNKLKDEWWEWSGDLRNCNADGTVKLTYGEWLLAKAKGDAK